MGLHDFPPDLNYNIIKATEAPPSVLRMIRTLIKATEAPPCVLRTIRTLGIYGGVVFEPPKNFY